MCVIAYKPRDVRFLSKESIRQMWETNSDGAGIMWREREGGEVSFVKGFMSRKKFSKWCERNRRWLDGVECAVHFRITTHGGTMPGNCHPFAIDRDADPHLLKGSARRILMHNGVLPIEPRRRDISDSAELAIRLGHCADPAYSLEIWNDQLSGNRIILMDENGTHFFGDPFRQSSLKGNEGILYSNLYWERTEKTSLSPTFSHFSNSRCGSSHGLCDTYYDAGHGVFRERLTGQYVPLSRVDPSELSYADYEIWDSCLADEGCAAAEAERLGMTAEEYRDCAIEAESLGMCVDDYVAMLWEGEDGYSSKRAG